MLEHIFTGKTVEEAIQAGLHKLRVREDQVKIDVIARGKKGLFGFGQQDAEVSLLIIDPELKKKVALGTFEQVELESAQQELTEESAPSIDIEEQSVLQEESQSVETYEQPEETTEPEELAEAKEAVNAEREEAKRMLPENAEKAAEYMTRIIEAMGTKASYDIDISGTDITINLSSQDAARIIGKRGQTLNALQTLAQVYMQQIQKTFCIVTLDIEDYRAKRKETLENLALNMSKKARATKMPVKFEPMPNYERKIMHQILTNMKDIETYSEGRDPHRYLVIKAK